VLVDARSGIFAAGSAARLVTGERAYAALLLTSVVGPSVQVAEWLAAPVGPSPVDLGLMASMLERAAARLTELDGPDGAR
jgi:hypothetical protein